MVYVHVASGTQRKPLPSAYHLALDKPQHCAVICAFAHTLDLAHSGPKRGTIDCAFPHAHNQANGGTLSFP